ncbi:LEPR-XLL domain-containing protein [Sagittula sp.]|uniref:LEPR-XLL domain-containing protein n=1 Tax=Sagittula sp. TaxID=2038081 RepID=UPI0035129B8C
MAPGGKLPGLKMEAMEPRFLLSADAAPFLADMSMTTGNDYLLKYDSLTQSINLYDKQANSLIAQRLVQEITYVRVTGTAGDDSLELDFSDGFVSPIDIRFDGGNGTDTVTLSGATLDAVTLSISGEGSADIKMSDASHTLSLSLTGTEAVHDQNTATDRLYSDATTHGQNIRIQDNSGSTADNIGTIAGDGLLAYTFTADTGTITVDAGVGDDDIALESLDTGLAGRVLLSGGAGTDAVTGPPVDLTWTVTGENAGEVAGVSFVSVETLIGAADTEDVFLVQAGGSLSGGLDGGTGGFDTLVFDGGSFQNVEYLAYDLHSGVITRDGVSLNYAGLEPINDNSDAANRVIDLSSMSDTAEITQDGTGLHITPSLFGITIPPNIPAGLTFETVNIATLPTESLTINLGDSADFQGDAIPFLSRDKVTISGPVDLGNIHLTIDGQGDKDQVVIAGDLTVGDLTVNAEIIDVTGSITANIETVGSHTSTGTVTLNALAEDDGVIVDGDSPSFLQGIGLEGFFVAATTATVEVSGSITAGGALVMTAEGAVNISAGTGDLAGAGVLDLTGVVALPDVAVRIDGATLSAESVTATATADIDVTVADDAGADDTNSTTADAAVSVVAVYGDSAIVVDGASAITATSGAVTLGAVSELNVATKADGSTEAGAKGATLAVATIGITTSMSVASTASITAGSGDVALASTLTSVVSTEAISTQDGADDGAGANQSEQRLQDPNDDGDTSDQAAGQGGSVSFAGAVAVTDYRPVTLVTLGGTVNSGQALTLTALSTDSVTTKADASVTGSGGGATGVGIGVAIGIVDSSVSASITGGDLTAANGVTLLAHMDADETFSIEAISGIGDGAKTAVAGSLAIHVGLADVTATVGGTLDLNGSNLSVSALSETRTVTRAMPSEDGVTGESTGVGASVALAIIDYQTFAGVDDNATITNGADLTLSATSNQDVETVAKSGATGGASGTAFVPVAAITMLFSDTAAEIGVGTGAVSFAGDIGLSATHDAGAETTGEGNAEGGTAVGVSFGLTVDEQTSMVRVLRDLASTGGAIALTSTSLIRSRTDAKASAAGAAEDDGSSPEGVDDTTSQQAGFADDQAAARTGSGPRTTDTQSAEGQGGGKMSVAAAISLTIQNVDTVTVPADGVSITADEGLSLVALSNVDALADADGSASKGTSGSIGAAASLTYSNISTLASSGAGTTLTGDGIEIRSGVATRNVPLTVQSGKALDEDADTIFLGEDHGLSTGDAVVYTNNSGGNDIGGLTSGQTYYIVEDTNGRVKLAATEPDANADPAVTIDLSLNAASGEHQLQKGTEDAKTFDPTADVFGLDSSEKSSLRTGDAVTYTTNGTDTDIGGLTNGTTYFAIIDDEGDLKLATSSENALKGEAIEITSAGSGTSHQLAETVSRAAADSTSGASDGDLGIAGSLAINVAEVNTNATHADTSTAVLRDSTGGDGAVGALTVSATAETMAGVDANAQQSEAGKTGVGFSFGLNITDHNTRATYEGGALLDTVTGSPDDVTVEASGTYSMLTNVEGGAQSTGGTGATPVLGISVAMNDTSAVFEDGDALTIGGDLTAKATHVADTTTIAKGDTKGTDAAVGISFALTVAEDDVTAQLLREVTSTGGGVSVAAEGASASTTESQASATGAPEDNSSQNVNDQTGAQAGQAQSQSAARTSSGATPSSASTGQGQANASNNGSSLTVAAAISLNIADMDVIASIDNGAVVNTTGAVEVTARGNMDAQAEADGSATTIPASGTNSTNIGAAVALNWGSADIDAILGDADVTAGGLTVQALMFERDDDDTHTFGAKATSGASGGSTGVAGSFALNLPSVSTSALVSNDAVVAITGAGDVVVNSVSKTESSVEAGAATDAKKAQSTGSSSSGGTSGNSGTGSSSTKSGNTIGVGVSIGVNVSDMLTEASLGGNAALTGAQNLTIEADGTHAMTTSVEGGAEAAGGSAVTPVIGISVAQNAVRADLPSGAELTILGDLTVKASLDADTSTDANGSADATNAAIGASLALTITFDSAVATLSRSVTAGGAVLVSAAAVTVSRGDARASAVGSQQANSQGQAQTSGGSVQSQTDNQVTEANNRSATSGTGNTATSPSNRQQTNSGQLTVAAAIGINIAQTESRAVLAGAPGTPITVEADGAVTVKSEANDDANARADGQATLKKKASQGNNTSNDTTIGAAIAVNVAQIDNIALMNDASVTGNGINVQALMAAREVKVEASELSTVDTDTDTIFVGEPEVAFTTGEQVTYNMGAGGTAIDGLTDGTDYYVILGDNGTIQLAASQSDAEEGKAIDLKDQGAGDAHELVRTAQTPENTTADPVEFDPDETRVETVFDNPGGLQTGEAVVYDTDGAAIGGLTDGETYFAIVEADGRLKLAASRDDAMKGEAVELTSAASGDTHKLTEAAHSNGATSVSGASGGKTSVAGSVAVNVALGETSALYGETAQLTVTGGGASTVEAKAATYTLTRALSAKDTAGKSLGLGLSFAIGVSEHDVLASVAGGATLADFGDLSVSATSDHVAATQAKAGSVTTATDGTSVGGSLALMVSLNDTEATVPAGATGLSVDGNLSVTAAHTLDLLTEADADTKGNTGVGIALGMAWAEDDTRALLGRDVSTTGPTADDVTVSATSVTTALTVSQGSSQGAKKKQSNGDGTTANEQSASATGAANQQSGATLNDPQPGSQVQSGNNTAATQTTNPGGQGGNGQQSTQQTTGGAVQVAGAIAATVIVSDAEAVVEDVTINATGDMTVRALNDADASSIATGLALNTSDGQTGVGAAVAVNVAVLKAQATVAAGTISTGSLTVEAGTSDGETNEMQTVALAGAGVKQKSNQQQNQGGGGTNTNGGLAIAGAAGVNYYESDTDASIADGATVTAGSGDVDMTARQSVGVQNIAGGASLLLSNSNGGGGGGSGSDGGTSVGAAVAVNIVPIDTDVSIGAGATVTAQGSVSMLADSEIVPMEIVIPDVLPDALGIGEIETGLFVTGLAIGASIASGGGDQQGSGSDAGAGSAVINVFTPDTRAIVGAGSTITATTGDISVRAESETRVTDSAGSLGFSTSGSGVGVGLDVTVHEATTLAIIEGGDPLGTPTTLQAGGNIIVEAQSVEDFFQLAVNVGAGDSTSGAGGANVLVNITDTQARINNALDSADGAATVAADGSVVVQAQSKTIADSYAGSGGGSLSGSAVGISVDVLVDLDDTQAIIGNGTDIVARGNGASGVEIAGDTFDSNGDPVTETVRGLAVTASSYEALYQLAIAASASLGSDNSGSNGGGGGSSQSGGGSSTTIGIAGAVTIAVLKGETKAVLGDDVDVNADAAANNLEAHALQGITIRGTDQTTIGQDAGGGTFALNGDVGLTGSVAVIDSDQSVWGTALGDNTLRSKGGGVTLDAHGATDIDTLVIAIAGVVDTGSSNQQSSSGGDIKFAGAGAVTVNLVDNEVLAEVGADSEIATTGALSIQAADNSDITSDSGGVAFALSTGQSQGGTTAGSVGASVAVNDITQTIRATVTDTPITAASVDMDAINNAEVDTLTIAGSAAVSNSSTAFGGAGSGSGNYIDATTIASISNPSGVQVVSAAGGAVSVNALDNAKINADAGAGALAVSTASSGNNAGAVAIGAAMAVNHITKTTTAEVHAATVTSAAFTTEALSTSEIDAFTFAVSGSLSSGSGTLSLSGAGSGSGNEVTSSVLASVRQSSITATGPVTINAAEAGRIDATTGSLGIALNVGSGTGAKVGVGLGIAVTLNDVTASAIAESEDTSINAGTQDVSITADNTASIDSTAFGVSLSVSTSQSGASVGVSANVAVSLNDINLETRALVTDTAGGDSDSVVAGDLTVSATDSGNISADATSVGLAVSSSSSSVSVSGAVNVSVADNTITSTTEALIDSVDATLGGAVDMDASSEKVITAIVTAASVGVSLGSGSGASASLTGAGSRSYNETTNSVLAVIRNADVTATGDVTLDAVDSTEISATLVAVAASVSVGGGSGASASLTVAVSDAQNVIQNTTRAVIEGGAEVRSTGGAMRLDASSDGSITATAVAASLGVSTGGGSVSLSGAGAGANADNSISNTVEAGVLGASDAIVDGALDITATDAASVTATVVTAAISADLGGSGSANITLSAAVSLADNSISNTVAAHVVSSGIDAGGAVTIKADSTKAIDAVQVAAAVAVSIGSGTVSFAGAFGVAQAQNTIGGSTTAGIFGADIASIGGALDIDAVSGSTINATLVAATASVSAGSGTVSLAMSAAIALATNEISSVVLAGIDDTPVMTTGGAVTVDATNSSQIDATSVGVAIAVSATSGSVSLAAALALAQANNTILGSTDAIVSDSGVMAGGAVGIGLTDSAQINADVIAASVSVSLSSGGVAGSLSVAVALSENVIGGTGRAAIDTASVVAQGGGITLDAVSTKSITATGVAAAISVSGSGSVAVSGAGAGVDVSNTITNTFGAEILNAPQVQASGSIGVTASDTSTITATIVSGAAAVAVGGSASVAGAVAVTLAENTLSGALVARISGSDVDALGGGVNVAATANNTIDATAVAASLSVSASGSFGAAGAGAGASATNTMTNSVKALIENGSDVDAAGAVTVSATDSSSIEAEVASVAASISGSSTAAISISIAVPIATNSISTVTLASIDASDVDATSVSVTSLRDGSITAVSAAVSVSISVSGSFSLSAAGAGAVADNFIGGGGEASIRGSNVTTTAGGVTVEADDTNSISATLVAASVGVAGSGGASISLAIAATVTTNELTGTTLATIQGSDVDAAGQITVDARNENTIDATAVAAAISVAGGYVGIAGAGAGAKSVSSMSNTVEASIIDSPDVDADTGVTIHAEDASTITNATAAAAMAVGVGAGGGAVSVAVTLVEVNYDTAVKAHIGGSDVRTTGGDVTLTALASGSIDVEGYGIGVAVSGGAVGISGAGTGVVTRVNAGSLVEASIFGGSDVRALDGAVILNAQDQTGIDVDALGVTLAASGGSVALSISATVIVAETEIEGTVRAEIDDSNVVAGNGNVDVLASSTTSSDLEATGIALSAAGGTFGGSIALAAGVVHNTIAQVVEAVIDNADTADGQAVTASGAVNVSAEDSVMMTAISRAISIAVSGGYVGLAVSVSAAIATNTLAGSTIARVQNSRVDANGGPVTVTAQTSSQLDTQPIAFAFSASVAFASLAAAGAGASGINTVTREVSSTIEAASNVTANGAVTVEAHDVLEANAQVGSAAVSLGLVGFAISVAIGKNLIATQVLAAIDDSTVTAEAGNILVDADATH